MEEESLEDKTSHRVTTSDDLEISTYLEVAKVRAAPRPKEGEELTLSPRPTGREAIAIIDFGSQYSQLIARRVRECRVYCELFPPDTPWEKVKEIDPKGFILSGGPASVYEPGAPLAPRYVFESGLPVLGICYGMQLIAHQLGGKVEPAEKREYGKAELFLNEVSCPIFQDLPFTFPVWMSHGDRIQAMPPGFATIASTPNTPIAAMARYNIFGLQFHPEVIHTPDGKTILANFLYKVCDFKGTWTPRSFVEEAIEQIRETVGEEKGAIAALSGGVDSAVAATLIHRAIGDRQTCIFVNNGLLRWQEAERNLETFRRHLRMNVVYVDASQRFLKALARVIDPEMKRRFIGEEFIRVFDDEARKLGQIDFLVQGTLYPDVIESATGSKAAAKIKTHHNVGGLPKDLPFALIEPLRYLFKDEVRAVGLELGLPEEIVYRQPFPGPGLAIRIIGEITPERLETLRAADWIVIDEMKKAGYYQEVWQSFAILTGLRSVGIMGDDRAYGEVIAVRIVTSQDGMTADWARLSYDLLECISNRIANEVPGVNRVVYDITSKPPATIEWE